jgi:hypothetical protein
MDTMKLFLGTIIALLLAALVMSWNGMQQGVKNTSAEETQRLSKQIEALKAEQDRLALERQLLQQNTALAVAPPIAPPAPDTEALKAQVDANSQQLALLAAEKEKAERDAKLADGENLLLAGRKMEEQNTLMREARLISQALLVGKITEYVEDAQYGGFVTLQVLMPEQVQQGSILAIRRKTGILGQIKVTSIEGGEAVASPLPGFGTIPPEAGDELILPPRF